MDKVPVQKDVAGASTDEDRALTVIGISAGAPRVVDVVVPHFDVVHAVVELDSVDGAVDLEPVYPDVAHTGVEREAPLGGIVPSVELGAPLMFRPKGDVAAVAVPLRPTDTTALLELEV